MEDEIKMRKCRACGKDTEVGKPCSNEECGWDEEAEQAEVKRNRMHKQIEQELDAADKKKKDPKGERRKGLFGR